VTTLGDFDQAQSLGRALLGRPYKLGSKWVVTDPEPTGPIDCSGFSRWFIFRCLSVLIPDGSYNQINFCERLPDEQQKCPPPLSLGFFAKDGKDVDHVVVVFDDMSVIEARGEPYNAVILRPIQKWLDQPGFLGFYAAKRPQA
jgi:cell wall-associated NlpC family hydrolase